MSRLVYEKFDTREGAGLKKKDYSTWAIWKSGIPIRIGQAMIINKSLIDLINLKKYKTWLDEAKKLLHPPQGTIKWADFSFRKNEIAAIKRELKLK